MKSPSNRINKLHILLLLFLIPTVPRLVLAGGTTETISLGTSFIAGLFTAFTPCVYPIIPMTISVLGSYGETTRKKAVLISGLYVFGMALVYSSLGMLAALGGQFFGSFASSPSFKLSVAIVMWIFAASMLGVYKFRLPSGVTNWANRVSQGRGAFKAFTAGAVSGLLAAGCTGPILAGVLTHIGASADPALAGLTMLSFSLGLGTPFLLLGTFLSSLPRPGKWMVWIESFLGIALVATGAYYAAEALYMTGLEITGGILIGGLVLCLSALIFWAVTYYKEKQLTLRAKVVPVVLLSLGVTGTLLGWTYENTSISDEHTSQWIVVESSAEFENVLNLVPKNQPVVIEFHADWCSDCRVVERRVFHDDEVINTLYGTFATIRVDATDNDGYALEELAKKYDVVGVPAVRFIDSKGHEVTNLRLNGLFSKSEFLNSLSFL